MIAQNYNYDFYVTNVEFFSDRTTADIVGPNGKTVLFVFEDANNRWDLEYLPTPYKVRGISDEVAYMTPSELAAYIGSEDFEQAFDDDHVVAMLDMATKQAEAAIAAEIERQQ